jgi:alginate O-acetyltransferase complex protein AlgJ
MVDKRFERVSVRLDRADEQFLDQLRKSGVDVIDLTPVFAKGSADANLFCRQDTHWSGRGCVLAAQTIAQHVRDRAWLEGMRKVELASEWRSIEIEGDLWRDLPEPRSAKEKIELRFVGRQTAVGLKQIEDDPASPVVLLGDSSCLIFHDGGDMHARGAGLADQLARELGVAVDVVAVRGSGATPARVNFMRAARKGGYLAGKRLVIWCFAAREFTEASWGKVKIVGRP